MSQASDPYDTEEYQRFVESMVPHCKCLPPWQRPCDGVLAGGLCDRLGYNYHTEELIDRGHDDED